MKKLVLSSMLLGFAYFSQAQTIASDTVITGTNYAHQKYYSLANGVQSTADFDSWNLAFGTDAFTYDAPIRFNSLVGDIRELPNADINGDLATADTSGWGAEASLYDQDTNYFQGALSRTTTDPNDLLYYWGKYNTTNHVLTPIRTFGALINTDFYLFRFTLNAVTNIYTIEYCKLGDTQSSTHDIDLDNYSTKNYVYYNVVNDTTLDLEPASADWDLFFGQYYTDYQGIQMYPVAGVRNNVGTEVAVVSTVDSTTAANASFDWGTNYNFSNKNNVINADWKNFDMSTYTYNVFDTLYYFVRAKDGAIWKLQFTGFVSGSGNGSDAGSYIFSKTLVSALGTEESKSIFTEMHPNPANTNVQLVVDATDGTTVDIYSMTGAKVYSSNLQSGLQTHNINTSDLENGVYQVVISVNGMQNVKKLVINH